MAKSGFLIKLIFVIIVITNITKGEIGVKRRAKSIENR
jgi:hypothetical protein